MAPALRVMNLGKRYRLGQLEPYGTLRDAIAKAAKAPLRRLPSRKPGPGAPEENLRSRGYIWALRNVSLDVEQGQALGIVGPNGAGKTTLLKILARITEPTEGRVEFRGRVSSLLEVGTGFHPELTGRENVYLNGAILGMHKREIEAKFDEIVAFAELGDFMDTPVKRYSAGMYVRLAFSVAAHMECDVLLVDEVLAVGDFEFQNRCLRRMTDIVKGGLTILFVSHNMGAIGSLCDEAILLDRGQLQRRGETREVIERYLTRNSSQRGSVSLTQSTNGKATGPARIISVATKDAQGRVRSQFKMGEDLVLEFEVLAHEPLKHIALSVDFKTITGIPVWHLVDRDSGFSLGEFAGRRRIRVTIPGLALYPGAYLLSPWIGHPLGYDYDYAVDCLTLEVVEGDMVTRNGLSWDQAVVACKSIWQEV